MLELPPFPLSPLDDGKPPHRIPRAVARVAIESDNWILRPCNGLLFARRERQNFGEWTWILARPTSVERPTSVGQTPGELPSSSVELSEMWREAVKNNWVARFALNHNNQMDCVFPHFFRSDGTGFVREFWNREDIAFSWKDKFQTERDVWTQSLDHFQQLSEWVSGDLFAALNSNWNYKSEDLHFICGSQNHLEQLARWICWNEPVFMQLSSAIEVEIGSESGFARAGLLSLTVEDKTWYLEVSDSSWESIGWKTGAPPARLLRLFELAIENNTPVGVNWEYNDQFSGRASVVPDAISLEFSFASPSHHDHLEARLQLRDWLKSRVSSSELDELLS